MNACLLLTSPNAVGLPAAERGDAPKPATRAVVDARWPRIERLLAEGQAAEAITLMETLALEMYRATAGDAPLFRDSLTLARRVLYDDLAQVGRSAEYGQLACAALARCAAWDKELELYVREVVSSLRGNG